MDNKLKEVVRKYYDTKCHAIIDKHFRENYPPEALTELHNQFDKGYIDIINKTSWSQDFKWGGTNRVYLMNLLLDPPNHDILLKYFSRSGEIQIGDAIAMLRLCDNMLIDEVHLMDVPAFICSAAFQQIQYEKVFLRNEDNWYADVYIQRIQFLIKMLFVLLTSHENFMYTNFIIHIPHYYETSYQVENFSRAVQTYNLKVTRKEQIIMKLPHCKYEVYSVLVNSLIHVSQYAMKLKKNIVRPKIWYYEPLVTPLERFVLDEPCLGLYPHDRLNVVYKSGMERAIDIIIKKGNKEELTKYLQNPSSEESVMYPQEKAGVFKSKINNIWAVDAMNRKFKDYPSKVFRERLVLKDCSNTSIMPIATTVIDIDKLILDNATKDLQWHLSYAQLLYSNAQEINALRTSFQSNAGDLPLLVRIKSSDVEFNDILKVKLDEITATLKSAHLHNYTYEIEES